MISANVIGDECAVEVTEAKFFRRQGEKWKRIFALSNHKARRVLIKVDLYLHIYMLLPLNIASNIIVSSIK